MHSWESLYADYKQIETQREERTRREQELEEFNSWCAAATDRVMVDITTHVRLKAEEFQAATGREVDVEYPTHAPIGVDDDGPVMSFMRIKLDSSEVHIYSHRGPGSLPAFHILYTMPTADSPNGRAQTLVSQPGCFVARDGDGGYQLRRARDGRSFDSEAPPMTLDELAYRAFEILIEGLRRQPRRGRAPT